MDDYRTTTSLLRDLEKNIRILDVSRQLNKLGRHERDIILSMQINIASAKTQMADSITSANSQSKLIALKSAIKHLVELQQDILSASQLNLISAIDVAHLTALAEQVIEGLSGGEDEDNEVSFHHIRE